MQSTLPNASAPKARRRSGPAARVRQVVLGLVFIGALFGYFVWHMVNTPRAVKLVAGQWVEDTGAYAGVAACRECHREIVEKQQASSHANTLRALKDGGPRAPFDSTEVIDPLTGARYRMDAQPEPSIAMTLGGQGAKLPVEFEFGSGKIARGYLSRLDDFRWLDGRLNHYAGTNQWDFTSGQEKPNKFLETSPLGRTHEGAGAVRCFACHTTVLKVNGLGDGPSDGAKLKVRPDKSVLGIHCESCHGPQLDHVKERRAVKPVKPRVRLTADEMNAVCGRCHGLTNVSPEHPVISRFQPWGLSVSRCYNASEGKLSCATCHDPHEDAKPDITHYNLKCLSCHSGKPESIGKTICRVNRTSGCVGCHMASDSTSMLHTTLTDHRIRIPGKEAR